MEENKKPNLDSAKSKSGCITKIEKFNFGTLKTVKNKSHASLLLTSNHQIVSRSYRRRFGLIGDLSEKLFLLVRLLNSNKNR